MEQTTIFLSPEDAQLFVQFQKRYLFVKLLESLGVFDLKKARVTIDFDKFGQIAGLDINKHYDGYQDKLMT